MAHSVLFVLFFFFTGFSCGGNAPREFQDFRGEGGFTATTILGLPQGTHYYHGNHLGSATVITNEVGEETTRITYSPYGEIVSEYSGVYDRENHAVVPAEDSVTHKFTGQELDSETSLYYYNARYYDPTIGLFTTADTIIDMGAGIHAFNRYMYVAGNPIKYTDPSGRNVIDQWNNWWNDNVRDPYNENIRNELAAAVGPKATKFFENIWDTIVPGKDLYNAYKSGGWRNVGLYVVSSSINTLLAPFGLHVTASYSYEVGYGFGGGYGFSKGDFLVGGGIHWQQKGTMSGWSIYSFAGFKKGGGSIGLFASYHLEKKIYTVGASVGYAGNYGAVGARYSQVYDEDGNKLGSSTNVNARLNSSYIIGKLITSPYGDGRERYIRYYQEGRGHITGFNSLDKHGRLNEDRWYLQVFDTLILRPTAVLHDYTCTVRQWPNLSDSYGGGMLLGIGHIPFATAISHSDYNATIGFEYWLMGR